MVKGKSIDEVVENYVIGAIQGAFKTKRYWMKRGFNEESSIKKAINYATGQLNAGTGGNLSISDAEAIFREIGAIAEALADMCKHASSDCET